MPAAFGCRHTLQLTYRQRLLPGIELISSWSGVRCSNQRTSQLVQSPAGSLQGLFYIFLFHARRIILHGYIEAGFYASPTHAKHHIWEIYGNIKVKLLFCSAIYCRCMALVLIFYYAACYSSTTLSALYKKNNFQQIFLKGTGGKRAF